MKRQHCMNRKRCMHRKHLVAAACLASVLLGLVGCTPRVRVTANPGPDSHGIRYYRPKPYLKIVPAEIQIARDASQIEPSLVKITLEYLPDFTEEYAIDVRPGLGVADVSLKLEDGWNLTEISQELDSQTDENISAAGDLIDAVSGLVPTAAGGDDAPDIEFTVPATDVPLGYYESVISRGPDGRKRLYGFRYLGFLPYQSCPTVMGGIDAACCNDPHTPLYGLTFEGGRMVFKPLAEMGVARHQGSTAHQASTAGLQMGRAEATDGSVHAAEAVAAPVDDQQRWAIVARVEIDLRRVLQEAYPAVREVAAGWEQRGGVDVMRVQVETADGAEATREAIRRLSLESLEGWLPGSAVDVDVR